MTRFPCIGDLHLQHTHRRNSDRLQALDTIIDQAIELGSIGAWCLLGDLYHQRSSIEDRNDLAPRLQRMAAVAPVLIIYGNHDGHGDLEILSRLKAHWPIVVIASAGVIDVPLPTGEIAAVFGIPYPHKHALVGAGVDQERLGDTASDLLHAIFLRAASDLAEAHHHGMPVLVLGHATIAGSVSSVGQPIGLDRDIAIRPEHLDRLGDVPKIFGHIHKPQELYGAYYAGSVCRNDFGEVEDKRWLLVEYARLIDNDPTFPLECGVHSMAIDIPRMYHIQGNLSVVTGFRWRVTRGPDGEDLERPSSFVGADVRVRYTFNDGERALLERHQDELTAPFAGARSIELEPIAIRERAHRAPEVQAAKTLPEKITAFVRTGGFEWTPSLDTKLAELQGPDDAVFVDQVRTELSGAGADGPRGMELTPAKPAPDIVLQEAAS